MKTPDYFIEKVNCNIITAEMIAAIIYSLNKRAKNWREKNPEKYREAKKIRTLSLIEGKTFSKEQLKTYEVLDLYWKKDMLLLKLFEPTCIHIINGIEYLLYEVHNSDFHLPGYIFELFHSKSIPQLRVKKLESFETHGEDPSHLVSLNFCNEVVRIIQEGNYTMVM
jgi:hypothetical protein